MDFHLIDKSTWKRKSYYDYYMGTVRCTYSVTVNIEVDSLIKKIQSLGIKAYPVQIYMISRIVNAFTEFRMGFNKEEALGYWDICYPSYTIFNKKTETFSSIYTPYYHDFGQFYKACIQDIETYRHSDTLFPQASMPDNLFTISSLPWLGFTSFNLNVYDDGTYLAPIFTIGRYREQEGKKYLPLAIQVHHAVCDGYHVGKFLEALQHLASAYEEWLC